MLTRGFVSIGFAPKSERIVRSPIFPFVHLKTFRIYDTRLFYIEKVGSQPAKLSIINSILMELEIISNSTPIGEEVSEGSFG